MPDKDRELALGAARGDLRAFSALMDRYKDRGMGLAFRILRNREDAEEALQDAFVRTFRGLAGFKGNSKFGTWFFRILYNVCATKAGQRRPVADEHPEDDAESIDAGLSQIPDDTPQPDILLETNEFYRIVSEAIDDLPVIYRDPVLLFLVQDFSYEEVSEVLGLSVPSVKTRIFRARALLRITVRRRLDWSPTRSETVVDEGDEA